MPSKAATEGRQKRGRRPGPRGTPGQRRRALLVVLSAAAPVRAQNSQPLAEALFQDGKRLMDDNRLTEACPKLADSLRLDPAPGTLLALALCHDLQGRTATAWAEYSKVLEQARQQRRADREQIASQRLAELKPQLSRLTVAVSREAAGLAGLVVRLDGAEFPPSAWGEATPIDPGRHTLEASAPRARHFKVEVLVGAKADTQTVVVPALEPASPPEAPPAAGTANAASGAAPRAGRSPWVGYGLLGGGALAAGAGLLFGLDALAKRDQANEACPQVQCADEAARDANRRALRSADAATVLVPVGALLAGAGLYLTLTRAPTSAKASPAPSLALTPSAAPAGGALWLRGAF